MHYWNGGLITATRRRPTHMASSGLFNLISQHVSKSEGQWPSEGIVTQGLIMHLDAGNSSSYPGTGSTWYDISGNSNDATLTQVSSSGTPATYSSSDGGVIEFDGVDDKVSCLNLSSYSNLTIEMWIYDTRNLSAADGDIATYAGRGSGGSYTFTTGGAFKTDGNGNANRTVNATVPPQNQWYHFCYVKNGSLWLDNTEYSSSSGSDGSYGSLQIGESRTDVSSYLNGKVSNVRVYNRSLTSAEVSKNYNATKGRFGY